MRIFVDHADYQEFQLRDGTLTALREQGTVILAQSGVEEFAVALTGATIYLVARVQGSLIHWKGEATFSSQEIGSDTFFGNGLKLIADSSRRLHLFYLARQPRGGSTLHHQIFINDHWTEPMVVSSNVSIDPRNFAVIWDLQGGVQGVYCSEHDSFLYYRSYNNDQRLWSGAVPLVRALCSRPVFLVHNSDLHLTWLEGEKEAILKHRVRSEKWQKEQVLSNAGSSVYESGWNRDSRNLKILWMQGGNLWIRDWEQGQWLGAIKGDLSEVKPGLWAVTNPDGSSFTNLYYRSSEEAVVTMEGEQRWAQASLDRVSSATNIQELSRSVPEAQHYPTRQESSKEEIYKQEPRTLESHTSEVSEPEFNRPEPIKQEPTKQEPTKQEPTKQEPRISEPSTQDPGKREHQLETQLLKQAFYWQKDLTDFKEDLVEKLTQLVAGLPKASDGSPEDRSFLRDLEQSLADLTNRLTSLESEIMGFGQYLRDNQQQFHDSLDQKLRTFENRIVGEVEKSRAPYVGKVFRK